MSNATLAASADVWQYRISQRTGEPAVPVFNPHMRGNVPFWVPRRYRAVVANIMDGRKYNVREMAARTGYSVHGFHAAVRALHKMGIGTNEAVRGRGGWSRFRFNRDCQIRNVPTNVRSLGERLATFLRTGTLVGTFTVETIDTGLEWPPEGTE